MTTEEGSEAAWTLSHHRGSAQEFHDREVDFTAGRQVWWFEVVKPTVVLGSTQDASVLRPGAVAELGVEVARRRSGGGAVWLAPGQTTWVDVVLPAADPRWDDDVSRATYWLGEAWVKALAALGRPGGEVHRGALVATRWSSLVCFGGVGPGEVLVGGAKVVGISQRRTRHGARFQCAVLHAWDPGPLVSVLALDERDRAQGVRDLASAATGLGSNSSQTVVQALLGSLTAS